jgi:hypothetical protein
MAIRPGSSLDGATSKARPQNAYQKLRKGTNAPSNELSAAIDRGLVAIDGLARSYPKDPAVLLALVKAYASEKRSADTMSSIERLAVLGGVELDDPEVRRAVLDAAQGTSEIADSAFSLMEKKLGSRGPDLLFELLTTRDLSQPLIARAKQSLARSEVRTAASPALLVALDLRAAKTCTGKRAVLERAMTHGDARALTLLRQLRSTKGCGFLSLGDCWSCLRQGPQLERAIAAIAARSGS